jgi:hypothetical protein
MGGYALHRAIARRLSPLRHLHSQQLETPPSELCQHAWGTRRRAHRHLAQEIFAWYVGKRARVEATATLEQAEEFTCLLDYLRERIAE